MPWLYLLLAGIVDIFWCIELKRSKGFLSVTSVIAFLLYGPLVFFLLSLAMHTIPLSTAYLVWTGAGAIGVTITGIIFYNDPVNFLRFMFLFSIILGILGLRIVDY